jgi:NitT/TauT family transport system ATP-binding protein
LAGTVVEPKMNLIETRDLAMAFNGGLIFSGVNVQVPSGKTVSIIGPSGCGKSTLLRLISGILPPTTGEVLFRGKKVIGPSRKRVLIFQNHALFPWLTALENIEFALEAKGLTVEERRRQGMQFLAQVSLDKFSDFYPHQLSGGMQQRVGIARALSADPDLLLLDEPFASLDAVNRETLLFELARLSNQSQKSFLLVTHDIEEAIFLSDEIYLMSGSPGRIVRRISVDIEKTEKIIDLKQSSGYLNLEREIHEFLFASR